MSSSALNPTHPQAGLGSIQISQSPASPPLSYLSARRPSLALLTDPPANDDPSSNLYLPQPSGLRNEASREIDSPDEDGKLNKSLQIDMKSMVGDSVGNMSISPTSRDIVLAARKGLFIIDLEAPLEVPRFLPQGGTWDVADVQWNPCPTHSEFIVSTSSERMLIWNLLLVGKTSIEFILQSHYRAITDINWHTFDPDLVCSTGIDSWIWAWDIRDPQKPAFGLCAFNAGGTQVKWNRKDGNILASSHLDEVLIWDRRKGSIPVSRMKAHGAKIYGIDWSHSRRDEIITCSLDKTIKVWDTGNLSSTDCSPSQTFYTDHPVWRARDLPFGHGVLSLPQRGETVLEMWSYDDHKVPVETFEGHTDVVKEFVWRSGGGSSGNDKDFQLITWSKDKTLRFRPIGRDIMQKVGASREPVEKSHKVRHTEEWVSFRSPPIGTGHLPALSAPRGHRSILAGVRATPFTVQTNPVLLPHHGSAARASRHELFKEKEWTMNNAQRLLAAHAADRHDGTMSKGSTKGGRPRMDPATWLSSFRAESVGPARLSSGSRPPSNADRDVLNVESSQRRSPSRGRIEEGPRDSNNALLDEINTVVNKLTPTKIKLERHDLTKHRSCTFGLHGPWGESSSVNVFVRVTFTFPRDYPSARPPLGAPVIEIERSPLITVKRRAYMQKRLREIRESQRPCLEACMRFLLYSDGGRRRKKSGLDSGTSSEEDELMESGKGKDFSASLIRDHPNLAEPRSSQGVFGPNGQLVCIFRSLPRLVKAVPQDLSAAPAITSRETDGVPRLFRSPLQLADAVRRLAVAANDHSYDFLDSRDPEDMENVLRIMNNLLSFSHPRPYSAGPSQPTGNDQNNYSLLPKRMTIVFIKDRSFVVGAHRKLAAQYSLQSKDPLQLCKKNAEIARRHSRFDHERLFHDLAAMLRGPSIRSRKLRNISALNTKEARLSQTKFVIDMLHEELLKSKDVQLLGMFAVILLLYSSQSLPPDRGQQSTMGNAASPLPTSTSRTTDYFGLKMRRGGHVTSPPYRGNSPVSPITASLVLGQSLSSSSSSRGSWSSLFNAGTVRHFIGGSQDQNQTKISPIEKVPLLAPDHVACRGRKIAFTRNTSSGVSVNMSCRSQSRSSIMILILSFSSNTSGVHAQMVLHTLAYAEMLHSWQLDQKRTELFKIAKIPDPFFRSSSQDGLGLVHLCQKCQSELKDNICPNCPRQSFPRCIVCRTPVKGISHNCVLSAEFIFLLAIMSDSLRSAHRARSTHAKAILGPDLHSRLVTVKVLLVGAGGIGCELLKDIVLTGFGDITLLDLDTIDLSNLNRQFLFRKKDIKQSKALVAARTARAFNPAVRITPVHANIKEPQFDVAWFRGFDIVLNALDNLDARRHVNKMCLAAGVPLVESGTAGYLGQVQPIVKGRTECFDCLPKPIPKTFPVCTIRSTPSQPIHCIVWAKSYLIPQLFGEDEESGDELDAAEKAGENAREIANLRKEAQAFTAVRNAIRSAPSPNGSAAKGAGSRESTDAARLAFNKVFTSDINNLLSMSDMWKNRAPPTSLDFDKISDGTFRLTNNLSGVPNGAPPTNVANGASTSLNATVSGSSSGSASTMAFTSGLKDQKQLTLQENLVLFVSSTHRLAARLRNGEESISFDKDDDDTLDFVTAASNLRSAAYGIPSKSRWEIKEMAGNIIPAIATTNAVIAGIIVLQALQLLRKNYNGMRNVHLQKKAEVPLNACTVGPPSRECGVCRDTYVDLPCDPERVTLAEAVNGLLGTGEGSDGGVGPREVCVYEDKRLLSDPDFDDNLDRTLASLNVGHGKFLTIVDEDNQFGVIAVAICQLPPNHLVDGPAFILPSPLPLPPKQVKPAPPLSLLSTPSRKRALDVESGVDDARPAKRPKANGPPHTDLSSPSKKRRLEEDGFLIIEELGEKIEEDEDVPELITIDD
ncbi:hypothetical protein M0805_008527 [Coniferiporia weirii]|nr:hypothetical protein M0805_008527 [Coniferiporia weirii]